MKLLKIILLLVTCLSSCSVNSVQFKSKEIYLLDDLKIVIPLTKDFDKNITYMHIQIWAFNHKVFEDTTETEYLVDNKDWPKAFKISDAAYVLYLKVFDAPDYNKLHQFAISDYELIKRDTLPYFYEKAIKIDGRYVYYGTLNAVETPCDNCDSCYYNPRLYYLLTERGFFLDSTLTINEISKKWKGFFGYNKRMDIVRPCDNLQTGTILRIETTK